MTARSFASGFAILLIGGSLASQAKAASISTFFTGGNNNSIGGMVFFDLNTLGASGLTINSLAVNSTTAAGTNFSLNIFTRTGTFSGFEASSAGWTLVSTGSGVTAGLNSPSAVDVSDFSLALGVTGIAIQNVGATASYTNGNGTNQNFSNSDLALALGSANNSLFGSVFTPRVANITINYTVNVTTTPESGSLTLASLVGLPILGIALYRRKRTA